MRANHQTPCHYIIRNVTSDPPPTRNVCYAWERRSPRLRHRHDTTDHVTQAQHLPGPTYHHRWEDHIFLSPQVQGQAAVATSTSDPQAFDDLDNDDDRET